jgi:hypothetical protein
MPPQHEQVEHLPVVADDLVGVLKQFYKRSRLFGAVEPVLASYLKEHATNNHFRCVLFAIRIRLCPCKILRKRTRFYIKADPANGPVMGRVHIIQLRSTAQV